MYKSCSKCGKIHDDKYKCRVNTTRKYDKDYNAEDRKIRRSRKWTETAIKIKEDSKYLCAVCLKENIYNYNNLEVHHIIKIRNDSSKAFDPYNLICLCQRHHKEADNNKISIEYLQELAKERIEEWYKEEVNKKI